MKKHPTIWRLSALLHHIHQTSVQIDGIYVPSRTLGFPSLWNRFQAAHAVFVGKADAVIWPEDEWHESGTKASEALARIGGAA